MSNHMKEAFEVWFKSQIWGNEDFKACLSEAWQAALLAHIQRGPGPEGWKEATIAWEVCASIHREYAKKKDPFFTTRQADFIGHAEAARSAMLAAAAPEPDQFRDAAKMIPAPAEVPMPQGYVERPSDYTGDIWIESQMRAYGDAREAAGYARGLRDAGRDAERYSFLRGDGGPTSVRWPRWEVAHWTGNWNPVSGKELDAAIDAALRGEVKP